MNQEAASPRSPPGQSVSTHPAWPTASSDLQRVGQPARVAGTGTGGHLSTRCLTAPCLMGRGVSWAHCGDSLPDCDVGCMEHRQGSGGWH